MQFMRMKDSEYKSGSHGLYVVFHNYCKHLKNLKANIINYARFEVFVVVKIKVNISWIVMLYSVVVGYQYFRGITTQNTLT
jgi:hypothetical protein